MEGIALHFCFHITRMNYKSSKLTSVYPSPPLSDFTSSFLSLKLSLFKSGYSPDSLSFEIASNASLKPSSN